MYFKNYHRVEIIYREKKTIFSEYFSRFQSRRNLCMPRGGRNARIKKRRKTDTHTKRKLFTRTIARSSVVNDTTALQDGYFYPSPKPSLSNPFSSSSFFFTTNKIILSPFLDNIIISFNLLIPLFIPSTLLGAFPEDACYTPREIYKI